MCWGRCREVSWAEEEGKEKGGRCGRRFWGVKKCGEKYGRVYGVSVEGVEKCVVVSGSGKV